MSALTDIYFAERAGRRHAVRRACPRCRLLRRCELAVAALIAVSMVSMAASAWWALWACMRFLQAIGGP